MGVLTESAGNMNTATLSPSHMVQGALWESVVPGETCHAYTVKAGLSKQAIRFRGNVRRRRAAGIPLDTHLRPGTSAYHHWHHQ